MKRRDFLTVDRTYYVRLDGSNSNDGLSDTPSGAFRTIQAAINHVATNVDPNTKYVTIQLAPGSYGEINTLVPHIGTHWITIQGTSTYGEVVNAQFNSYGGQRWTIKDLTLDAPTGQACVYSRKYGTIELRNVQFNRALMAHINLQYGSQIILNHDYRIIGDAPRHILCQTNSMVVKGTTITTTFVGSRNFSTYFVASTANSVVRISNWSFVGTVTGKRYYCTTNGVLTGSGGLSTYLPGSIAGTTELGGVYT